MRFAVIGSGKLAVEVCKHLIGLEGADIACVIADPRHETAQTSFAGFASSRGIRAMETTKLGDDAGDLLESQDLDYVISANNHFILKKAHLASARRGTLNFHNGPLPRYAGINPCSWALLNGESSYGVTWHFVDEGVDTGDVVRQESFAIEPEETAIELIARCIDVGIEMFPLVAKELLGGGVVQRTPQNLRERSYFGIKDRPWNGRFPFWAPREELRRLERALAFWPMPNLFYKPTIIIPGYERLHAGRYEYNPGASAGMVGEANRSMDGLVVTTDGGSALLTELVDDHAVAFDPSRLPERMTLSRD